MLTAQTPYTAGLGATPSSIARELKPDHHKNFVRYSQFQTGQYPFMDISGADMHKMLPLLWRLKDWQREKK
jgi:hypothetical protein